MNTGRVKRGPGPMKKLSKATYRKKALPFLLEDFNSRCAYCLDPGEFRHPSQQQIDHFNCRLGGRRRHQYKNLMLACAACNLSKHDKPIANPFDKEQRLLNCTLEHEFPEHIVELPNGQWVPKTKAGEYHLRSIGLQEPSHQNKRGARRMVAERIRSLCLDAIQYQTQNPIEIQRQLTETIAGLIRHLDAFPPLVTHSGVHAVRDWLLDQGIDISILM